MEFKTFRIWDKKENRLLNGQQFSARGLWISASGNIYEHEKETMIRKSDRYLLIYFKVGFVLCAECKHWGDRKHEWHGNRPCELRDGKFFVGGGDNNDGLYTEPEFGCVDGEEK